MRSAFAAQAEQRRHQVAGSLADAAPNVSPVHTLAKAQTVSGAKRKKLGAKVTPGVESQAR